MEMKGRGCKGEGEERQWVAGVREEVWKKRKEVVKVMHMLDKRGKGLSADKNAGIICFH